MSNIGELSARAQTSLAFTSTCLLAANDRTEASEKVIKNG
jgi:hypothetical protein